MTGPVCYVERAGSGTLIRGIRLVDGRADRVWSSPAVPEGALADPGAAIEQTRAAARWVAGQLPRGVRSLSNVCVDVDGGLCLWLSAPGTEPAIVAAAMSQGRSADDAGANDGGGGLLAMASAGAGMERSIQALAGGEASRAKRPSRGIKSLGERRRMAVLSVPDLTVRLFLDELDALGVEVQAVGTLWHAMAAAWDPDHPGADRSQTPANGRIAASVSQCSAVVLLEPASSGSAGTDDAGMGRLIWSWSAGGELVAGGAMRLRSLAVPSAPIPAEPSPEGARRVEIAGEGDERTVLCGAAEAGRLVADWLAWSAQLGLSPSRIICVGPIPAAETDGPGFVELLAGSWHGAAMDAAVHPDPVGATLERIGGRDADPDGLVADPRSAMVELSHRPGRAHRRMYRWGAGALVLAAAAVGLLGWRLSGAADQAQRAAADLRNELQASLAGVETIAPNLGTTVGKADPQGVLRNALNLIDRNRPRLDVEEPILAELGRFVTAMSSPGIDSEMKLEELQISSLSSSATLILRESDALTGPLITDQLRRLPGHITWNGDSGRSSLAGQSTRTWHLSGFWVPKADRPPAGQVAGAGPVQGGEAGR